MADWLAFVQKSLVVDLTTLVGVRELIIALVVLVVVYMLVVVLRMKSLGAQRRFEEIAAARYEADRTEHAAGKKTTRDEREPSLSAPTSAVTPRKGDIDALYGTGPKPEVKNKYFEPPEVTVASFDQEKLTRLERDLSATREELDALRTAFAQTRDTLQAEIERLKAGQRVAPAYGDSLQMAMAGASAEEIASRCGIARAEAELVLSLARGTGSGDLPDEPGAERSNDKGGRSRYGSY